MMMMMMMMIMMVIWEQIGGGDRAHRPTPMKNNFSLNFPPREAGNESP
jgi:hypothetical protein